MQGNGGKVRHWTVVWTCTEIGGN